MVLRREVLLVHENTRRDNKLQALKAHQAQVSSKLQKVDKIDTLSQKVKNNSERLESQRTAINNQADTITTVIQNIEGLKISYEQQALKADNHRDIIIAEIRKSNENAVGKADTNEFPHYLRP